MSSKVFGIIMKRTTMLSKKTIIYLASFTCVIHCLLLPILLVLPPFIDILIFNPLVEVGLLILSIVCGGYIVYSGFNHHRQVLPLISFTIGIVLWIGNFIIELWSDIHLEVIMLTLGSCFVLFSYYNNNKELKCCDIKKE